MFGGYLYFAEQIKTQLMSAQATLALATLEQAQELGLLPEEFDKIKEILGRTPTLRR